jgi:hypothetical protein
MSGRATKELNMFLELWPEKMAWADGVFSDDDEWRRFPSLVRDALAEAAADPTKDGDFNR